MKIKCACGQTYDDKNLTKHLNSKHHQELLKKDIPSLKLTWHLKIHPWKRRFLLETIIFGCYVSFREGNKNPAKAEKQYQKNKKRADKLGYK